MNLKRINVPHSRLVLLVLLVEVFVLSIALLKGRLVNSLEWVVMFNFSLILCYWTPREAPYLENSLWKFVSIAGSLSIACQFVISIFFATLFFSNQQDPLTLELRRDLVWMFYFMLPVSCICLFYLWPKRKAFGKGVIYLNGKIYASGEEYNEHSFLENKKRFLPISGWKCYVLNLQENFAGKIVIWNIEPIMDVDYQNKNFDLKTFYTEVRSKIEKHFEQLLARIKSNAELEQLLLSPDFQFSACGNTICWKSSKIKKRPQ
jgi:hypothetical protein